MTRRELFAGAVALVLGPLFPKLHTAEPETTTITTSIAGRDIDQFVVRRAAAGYLVDRTPTKRWRCGRQGSVRFIPGPIEQAVRQ